MTRSAEHALAMAAQLERLLQNAWGALQVADPDASTTEFRAALITAAAKMLVRHAPPSLDLERQADAYRNMLLEQMRRERGRERNFAALERLLNSSTGPGGAR